MPPTDAPICLLPIEQHLALCRTQVQHWLADETTVPDMKDVVALQVRLQALLEQPIVLTSTSGERTLNLHQLDKTEQGEIPELLWQKMQSLRANVLGFKQDLTRFSERLTELNTLLSGLTPH